MRDLNELKKLLDISKTNFTKLTFEATVTTGFEQSALDECIEKFGKNVNVGKDRGRIFFNTKFDKYEKYKQLRSVDHVNILAGITSIPLTGDKDKDLLEIKNIANLFDWEKALTVWQEVSNFKGIVYPTLEEYNYAAAFEGLKQIKINGNKDANDNIHKFKSTDVHFKKTELETMLDSVADLSDDETKNSQENNSCPIDKKVPRFRVTCNRVGDKHSFTSMEAAHIFGGRIQDKFNWLVNLSHYDIDVNLEIIHNDAYIGISLNLESNHRRNIQFFGPTTLRATICYNLLRLCDPKPGDIIVDPLCGVGSIPIEGSKAYSNAFNVGGEIHDKGVEKTKNNINALENSNLKIDSIQWDATHLPLRTNSVDIFVTDLPFGKRIGSKSNNKLLYRRVLNEMARVMRVGMGRSVFLTHDQNSFSMAFQVTKPFWKQRKYLLVNIGGLRAACYLLERTEEPYFLKLSKREMKWIARKEWEKKKKEMELGEGLLIFKIIKQLLMFILLAAFRFIEIALLLIKL